MKRKRNIPRIQFCDVNEGTQVNYFAPYRAMFYGMIRPTYSNKDRFKIYCSGWAPDWLTGIYGDFSSVEEAEESILSAFAAYQKSKKEVRERIMAIHKFSGDSPDEIMRRKIRLKIVEALNCTEQPEWLQDEDGKFYDSVIKETLDAIMKAVSKRYEGYRPDPVCEDPHVGGWG